MSAPTKVTFRLVTPREKYQKAWRNWRSWERLIDCVGRHDQTLLAYVLDNPPADEYGLNDAYWGRSENGYAWSEKVGTLRAQLLWQRDETDYAVYTATNAFYVANNS